MKLGVGITTYNRLQRLRATVEAVRELTNSPHTLLVADDGSKDRTTAYLSDSRIGHFAAENRGIAWNKNRLIFYLAEIERCDIVILLEDDTFPTLAGWEESWVRAAQLHGHINLAGGWFRSIVVSGHGTPEAPFQAPMTSGQCVVFTRRAISSVGYMDSRFKNYGFEHGEHTERLVRAGYGGNPRSGMIYLLESPLHVTEGGIESDTSANAAVYEEVRNDASKYRLPWRGDAEERAFMSEMFNAQLYSTSMRMNQVKFRAKMVARKILHLKEPSLKPLVA